MKMTVKQRSDMIHSIMTQLRLMWTTERDSLRMRRLPMTKPRPGDDTTLKLMFMSDAQLRKVARLCGVL